MILIVIRLGKKTGPIKKNQRKNRDDANLSIVKIGLNTEKSPGGQRRLAVIQTPVKDYIYIYIYI